MDDVDSSEVELDDDEVSCKVVLSGIVVSSSEVVVKARVLVKLIEVVGLFTGGKGVISFGGGGGIQ